MGRRIVVVDRPEYDLEEIKKRIDLRAVITPGKGIRGDKPTKTLCLWHQESAPSLYVYPDHCHCFGCGEHMDVLDFVAWQEGLDVERGDFAVLLEIIDSRYRGFTPSPRPVSKPRGVPEEIPASVAEYFHRRLGSRRRWFRQRGIKDETIDREKLGYERRAFTIPVWSFDGRLLTMRFRRDDEALGDEAEAHSKYWGMAGRNEGCLYNARALSMAEAWRDFPDSQLRGVVVICEGELDALRLSQEGIAAVSAINGKDGFDEGLMREVRAWDPERVIVAYDQDPQGRIRGIQVARMFGLRGWVARWPREWGKDVTDVLKRRSLERLLETLGKAERPVRLQHDWIAMLRNGIWR